VKNMLTLEPCPFCGKPPAKDRDHCDYLQFYCETVGCLNPHTRYCETEAMAIAAWNRRPPSSPVQVKALEWSSEPPYSVARPFSGLHYATEVIWPESAKSFDYVMLSGPTVGAKRFASLSDAKAAAQADYEAEQIGAQMSRAESAERKLEEQRKALEEVRAHFRVEYPSTVGGKPSVGYDSEALPKIIAILDRALTPGAAE